MASSAEQVVDAIVALADWKGSSRQSLVKYLVETHGMAKEEASAVVSEGVREALAAGTVIQTRQSFTAKGHTFAKPADITLGIEELVPPADPASKAAKVGDVVDVAYVGKHPDGAVFEESTLVFVLGAGDVIKAWDEGIVGMRVGQQRRLTAPPKLAYGKRGSPPEIGPDATLLFDITFHGFKTMADVEDPADEEEDEEEYDDDGGDDGAGDEDDEEEEPKAKKSKHDAEEEEEEEEDDGGDDDEE